MIEVQIDVKLLCKHLKKLVKILTGSEFRFDLNDGYSDWIVCRECGMGIRLEDNLSTGIITDMDRRDYWKE